MQIPRCEPIEKYWPALCKMVADTSLLPHRDTVRALDGAVFRTARTRREKPRFDFILKDGVKVGMYDDNTTPTWALLWAHGILGGVRTGWSFAHVWPDCDDMTSYTHLANLIMIPECFASLTDKTGPLTGYLRWHAWTVYGWKPTGNCSLEIPPNYSEIEWKYFDAIDDPKRAIQDRLAVLNNERVRILNSLPTAK